MTMDTGLKTTLPFTHAAALLESCDRTLTKLQTEMGFRAKWMVNKTFIATGVFGRQDRKDIIIFSETINDRAYAMFSDKDAQLLCNYFATTNKLNKKKGKHK